MVAERESGLSDGRSRKGLSVGAIAFLLTIGVLPAAALSTQTQRLAAPEPGVFDQFGVSVAIDGDTALIGAMLDDDEGQDAGAVYVFVRNGAEWVFHQKLSEADTRVFGTDVALSGDAAVVSEANIAPFDTGTVWFYERNDGAWSLVGTSSSTLPQSPEDVAVDGKFTAVASVDSVNQKRVVVEVFRGGPGSGLSEGIVPGLEVDDPNSRVSVAIEDLVDVNAGEDRARVALSVHSPFDNLTDRVAIYDRTRTSPPGVFPIVHEWSLVFELNASQADADFGASLALDDDTLVVGAAFSDVEGVDAAGSVFVFNRPPSGLWDVDAELKASDAAPGDRFGGSVALDGTTLLVSAGGRGEFRGAVYQFELVGDSWEEVAILTAADGMDGDDFGHSTNRAVAISGTTALIGVKNATVEEFGAPISGAGAAYVFDLDAEPRFDDVPESHFFFTEIEWLAVRGITAGCTASLFCPEDTVTRAQMASFLVRALGLPPTSTDYFSDDDGNVHEANINALAEANITSGCNVGNYCPNDDVRRDQMASFLVRAFGLAPTAFDYFADDAGNTHELNINALAESGITTGCAQLLYCPGDSVTRAQMAAFLFRGLHG